MMGCTYPALIWDLYAFRLKFVSRMNEREQVWYRIHSSKARKYLHAIITAMVYWNIWREKNSIIFAEMMTPSDVCALRTYTDILFWAGLLFDEERLHLPEDFVHDDAMIEYPLEGREEADRSP